MSALLPVSRRVHHSVEMRVSPGPWKAARITP